MAVFELFSLKPKDYRILFKVNDKIEFLSKSFNTRIECLQMLRFMRTKGHKDIFYRIKNLNCGSWYFEFVAPNSDDVLGHSNTYVDKTTVLDKISIMKAHANKAKFKNVKID